MNILMLTNTFTPHVGGVARSVQGFVDEFRRQAHRVLVAAPLFKGAAENERDVVRFPTVQRFNGSDFSVPMPEPVRLLSALRTFHPEVVHSHHPFLLGGTALRVAAARDLPLVFTHHTMYEKYTHYVPGDSPRLKRFVIDLVTGYCNLCDAVIAPSETVAELLRERGVLTPITVVPSGVEKAFFSAGDKSAFRKRMGIPPEAFVVGHVGRLAPEKNLEFLTEAVTRFLAQHQQARFFLVGLGPSQEQIRTTFTSCGLAPRLHSVGFLEPAELAQAYKAMDVFVFASHTETQGMVLAEAMAAGVPVVAVEASGVREVVSDGHNGRLLRRDDVAEFALALRWIASQGAEEKWRMEEAARVTAAELEVSRTAAKTIELYKSLIGTAPSSKRLNGSLGLTACRHLKGEWQILRNVLQAAGDSIRPTPVWEVEPAGIEESASPIREPAVSKSPTGADPSPLHGAQKRPGPSLRARILGWFWASLLRFQCATWRKQYEGLDCLDQLLKEDKKVLFSFWHGKYVPLFALMRGRPACVFTSQSARGEVIVEICRRFGYDCVQIADHGRTHCLELMQKVLVHQQSGGIAVDGPLGPYHRVRRGAIKLASELGFLVVPASVSAKRKRILKHRWDRLELPGLFTKVGLAIGRPIEVPPGLSAEEMRSWADRLREALEYLDRRAEELSGAGRRARV
jgi:Glycosyltransferase